MDNTWCWICPSIFHELKVCNLEKNEILPLNSGSSHSRPFLLRWCHKYHTNIRFFVNSIYAHLCEEFHLEGMQPPVATQPFEP